MMSFSCFSGQTEFSDLEHRNAAACVIDFEKIELSFPSLVVLREIEEHRAS